MADLFPDQLPDVQACIAELRREQEMRKKHYPSFILRGVLSEVKAKEQQRLLAGAVDHLEDYLKLKEACRP